MFRLKICGVTSAGDAIAAVECGADAVGINFCRQSPRYVEPAAAVIIADAVRDRCTVVGVFVDETPARIGSICSKAGIAVVQLSGNEPPGDAAEIPFPKVRAVRIGGGSDLSGFDAYPCDAFLLDAHVPGEFGGTGKTLEWSRLPSFAGRLLETAGRREIPWLLAGGLNPENVKEAIVACRPFGVDVASGVESSPGRKDREKVSRFINNAREGFAIAGR
jgi:phosphoribosylanthranilate isomerase